MSPLVQLLLFILPALYLATLITRDFPRALYLGTAILVSATPLIRIELPGALPEFTLHRAILMLLFIGWLKDRDSFTARRHIPIGKPALFWLGAVTFSLLGASSFGYSFKRYLDIAFERLLFLFIICSSIRSPEQAVRLVRAIVAGLFIVSLLAILEKATGYNPVETMSRDLLFDRTPLRDVTATFHHRILLGAAMAMGWPLSLAIITEPTSTALSRRLAWASIASILLACYYAMSRGPWLACFLAASIMTLLGNRTIRVYLAATAGLVVCSLLLRPGILLTLAGFAKDTADISSHKGGSFMWRFELWRIAWNSIATTPWRFLFGYGPASGHTEAIEWSWTFRDRTTTVDSWDNQYAYYLFQTGIVGFAAVLKMYWVTCRDLFKHLDSLPTPRRAPMSALIASLFVYFFMMTNVLLFARQLDYLFSSVVAAAFAYGGYWIPTEYDSPVTA